MMVSVLSSSFGNETPQGIAKEIICVYEVFKQGNYTFKRNRRQSKGNPVGLRILAKN